MSVTRFTNGSVTVTLDGGLEKLVRSALDAAAGETVRVMEAAAGEVAAQAKSAWYNPRTGVRRRTGKSGDIQVITTVSESEVRVSVGSTDVERVTKIHRAGPLSTVAQEIDAATYYAAKRKGGALARTVFLAKKTDTGQGIEAGKYYRLAANPDASDGKYLIPELVRKPMTMKVKAITPALGRAIAEKAGGS